MLLVEEFSQCDDDELREFCNQACEAFVQRCPEAMTEHIPAVSVAHKNTQNSKKGETAKTLFFNENRL